MLKFRTLKSDEIDVRIGQFTPDNEWATLLLYKDARCDMAILDEAVGPMNWKKSYSRDNANCILSIWDEDKKQWIDKEDSGSAGNFERDKSLASDSFKRAAVSWGIGRELYTGPKLYFPTKALKNYNIERKYCSDRFTVTDIKYDENRNIVSVNILNESTGYEFQFSSKGIRKIATGKVPAPVIKNDTPKAPVTEEKPKAPVTKETPKAPVTEEKPKAPATEESGEVDTTYQLPFDDE